MRFNLIPMLVLLFFITHFSFGQVPASKITFQSNTLFVKIKDASSEQILFPNPNKEILLNAELKKIIETYKISSIHAAFNTTEKTDARLKRVYILNFPQSTQKELIINALRKLSFIDYAESIPLYEAFHTPNDYNLQQWNLPKINATQAWDLSTGSGKVIAIVDDAVRLTHEDLAANIWVNPLEIAANGIDDDGNGYVDDVNGYDVADNDGNPTTPVSASNSEFTHGTHCGGIAAAVSNNGKGIASIGYNNKIMAVKCKKSSDFGGSLPYAYSGLAYAIETNADVISMSWGGYYHSFTYQLLFDVAYDAGIICVAAAGNSNTDIPMYPASYNHVISVAATDQNDVRASFSNYGSTIDVSAPGVDIYSSLAGSNNSYGMLSGTSMACPLVSGLCALMLSYDPTLTPDELERCLKDNADNINNLNPGYIGALGAGRINAYQTMLCLQKTPTAAFQSDKQFVCPGQTVSYTDMSSLGANTGLTWSWSFPGGVPATSSSQNPTVVYNTAGSYSATLTVTNSFGNSVLTKANYITVSALTAVLSGTASIPTGGNALLKVDFSNSAGPFTIEYSDGTIVKTINNINSNPYYFTVTPTQITTYTLTSLSTSNCIGTFSGNAIVTVGSFGGSTLCAGISPSMFERTYGNWANNHGNNILQSGTGENYLIGMNAVNTSSANFSISKLDAAWHIVWTKVIGTSSTEYIYSSVKSTDGNIMICGTTTINGSLDAYVAKVDFNGNIIWSKTFGGSASEYAFSIQNTSDGGYVLGGRAESYSGSLDAYVVKMNASGTLQWSKVFGRDGNDYAFSCVQTADGGYIMGSASQQYAFTNYDYLVTKLDGSGNVSWSKYYGSSNDEGPRKLIVTSDGGYLIGGHSRYRNTTTDAMVTKLDASGNLLWSKTFGGNGGDDIFTLAESTDGNYMVAGITDSYGAGGYDICFMKFDPNGNILWSKLYGGTQNDYFPSMGNIHNSSDGGYTLVGTTLSFGTGASDSYLVKTDCNGNTDCSSSEVTFQNYNLPPTLIAVILSTDETAPGSGNPVSSSTNITLSASSFCIPASCSINADFYASDTTICKGSTITFTSTSSAATAYSWYLNNTLIHQSLTTFPHTFPVEGDYKVILVAENSSCSDSDTLTIHVVGFPQLVISDDMKICKNTTANLLVSGAVTYQWLNTSGLSCTTCANPIATPTTSQYFIVRGTDVNGCSSKDSVKIIVQCCVNGIFSPKGAFSLSDTTICVNDIVAVNNLSFTSNNSVQAQWNFSNAAVPQFSSAIQPGNIQFTQPGRWPITLIIVDDCGRDSIVNYINVFNPPVIEPYPDVFLCAPTDSVQFDITPISDYSYSWTPIFGLSNPLIANPWVELIDTSIVYTRTITDNVTGCENSDIIKVSSHTSFRIVAMNDTTIVGGEEVTLKACCTNYSWSPSTYLDQPNALNPIATPNNSIWYYVQGVDSIGCIARDSVLIAVSVLEPFIPNLVTPNGDQLNDTFKIRHLCSDSHVEIYNRWGELIFTSEDYKNEWDGKNHSDGIYFVSFKSGCGGDIYKGWLHLLRTN